MKKSLLLASVIFLLALSGNSQSAHEISFKSIDGDSIKLNTYAGKKVMFILVPLTRQDSVFEQLMSFKARYADTIQVIGVLSIEDGFTAAKANSIKSLYAGTGIKLTEGMYTRKGSSNQSLLMQWLTYNTRNRYFNTDATGIGHNFFINETGRLFAVLPPQATLYTPIINRIVHSSNRVQ